MCMYLWVLYKKYQMSFFLFRIYIFFVTQNSLLLFFLQHCLYHHFFLVISARSFITCHSHYYSGPRLNIFFCSKYSPQSNFRKIIYIKIIFFNGAVCELFTLAICCIALCRKYIKDVNKVQIYICNLNCIILSHIPAYSHSWCP